MAPWIVLLSILMPVVVAPALMTPLGLALATLPVTVAPVTLMQLMAEELTTGPLAPVTVTAQAAAAGPGSLMPSTAAAPTSELVASSRRVHAALVSRRSV